MAQQAMHAQMGGDTGGAEELVPAGAVTFGLEYRTNVGTMNDEGICIHVYGNDIPGEDKELLRFDCFRINPHYHYRNKPVNKNIRLELDFTAEGDPLGLDPGQDQEPSAHHAAALRGRRRRPQYGPAGRECRPAQDSGLGGNEDTPAGVAEFRTPYRGPESLYGIRPCTGYGAAFSAEIVVWTVVYFLVRQVV